MEAAGRQSFLNHQLNSLVPAGFLSIRARGRDCSGVAHYLAMADDYKAPSPAKHCHLPLFNLTSGGEEVGIIALNGKIILQCNGDLTDFSANMSIYWNREQHDWVQVGKIADGVVRNYFDGRNKPAMGFSVRDYAGDCKKANLRVVVSKSSTACQLCEIKFLQGKENVFLTNISQSLSRVEKALLLILAIKAFHGLYKLNTYMIPIPIPHSMARVQAPSPSLNFIAKLTRVRMRASCFLVDKESVSYSEIMDETNAMPVMILRVTDTPDANCIELVFTDLFGSTLFLSTYSEKIQTTRNYDDCLIGTDAMNNLFDATGHHLSSIQHQSASDPMRSLFRFCDAGCKDLTRAPMAVCRSRNSGNTMSLEFLQQSSIEHKVIMITKAPVIAIQHFRVTSQYLPVLNYYPYRYHS